MFNLIMVLLVLAILLVVVTSMMGSSRTLYQSSMDGCLRCAASAIWLSWGPAPICKASTRCATGWLRPR